MKISGRALLITAILAIACAGSFAEEATPPAPPQAPDPADELQSQAEEAIGSLGDPDQTKLTLAAARLIDIAHNPKTGEELEKKIRLALQARLVPEKNPPEAIATMLRVFAQKAEKFFNQDIVNLACRGDAFIFDQAMEALKKTGDERTPAGFVEILKDGVNPIQVRLKAARGLNCLKAWKSIPDLIAARQDPSEEVAVAAQQALEGIAGYPFGRTASAWKDWFDKNGARAQTDVLYEANLLLAREILNLLDPKSLSQNLKAIKSGIGAVQEKAIDNISGIQDPMAIPDLLEYLISSPTFGLRVKTVKMLGDLAGAKPAIEKGMHKQVAEALRGILAGEKDPQLVRSAIAALGRIGRVEGLFLVKALIPFLKSESAGIRAEAAMSIGKINGEEAKEALDPLCESLLRAGGEAEPRKEAAWALGILKDPRAVGALGKGLGDPDVEVRWNCANSLLNIADKSSFGAIHAAIALESEDRIVEVLVKALRVLRDALALDDLAQIVSRKPALAEKVMEAILDLAPDAPTEGRQAAEKIAKDGKPEFAIRILKAIQKKNPSAETSRQLADLYYESNLWLEAAEEYSALLRANPADTALCDRMLRAICQVDDATMRGVLTARALSNFGGERASRIWSCMAQDLPSRLAGREKELAAGLVKGFEKFVPNDAMFDELTALLVKSDGKVASSLHSFLSAWTGRVADPLAEDAREDQRKQVQASWKEWWTANKNSFPFSRPG